MTPEQELKQKNERGWISMDQSDCYYFGLKQGNFGINLQCSQSQKMSTEGDNHPLKNNQRRKKNIKSKTSP